MLSCVPLFVVVCMCSWYVCCCIYACVGYMCFVEIVLLMLFWSVSFGMCLLFVLLSRCRCLDCVVLPIGCVYLVLCFLLVVCVVYVWFVMLVVSLSVCV